MPFFWGGEGEGWGVNLQGAIHLMGKLHGISGFFEDTKKNGIKNCNQQKWEEKTTSEHFEEKKPVKGATF